MADLDWDNFDEENNEDFLAEGAEPVEAPKACSLGEDCEACQ